MAEDTETGTGAADQEGRGIAITKIYLKDASFESPETPQVFTGEWNPKMSLSIDTTARDAGEGRYEVNLKINLEAKQDGKTAFLAEVQQAGIFVVRGLTEEETQRVVGGYCPAALFPYAREVVHEMVLKGGFPMQPLQPVNFEALYQQKKQK